MKKFRKGKLLSLLLTVAMIVSLVPAQAFAVDESPRGGGHFG